MQIFLFSFTLLCIVLLRYHIILTLNTGIFPYDDFGICNLPSSCIQIRPPLPTSFILVKPLDLMPY